MAEPATLTPIAELAAVAARVLDAARGLTMPIDVTAYGPSHQLSLQFVPERDSYDTIATWAEVFGATLTSRPWRDEHGRRVNICRARFEFDGIAVEAFAVIPAATAA